MEIETCKWEYVCPICKNEIVENHSIEVVKQYVGATHDCPKCDGLLMIEEDLSCSDFGEELVKRYEEAGVETTKEQATSNYIEI